MFVTFYDSGSDHQNIVNYLIGSTAHLIFQKLTISKIIGVILLVQKIYIFAGGFLKSKYYKQLNLKAVTYNTVVISILVCHCHIHKLNME